MSHRHSINSLIFLLLIVSMIIPSSLEGQKRTPYYDGPYVFDENDNIRIQWVEKGYGQDTIIAKADATLFKRDSLPVVDLRELDFHRQEKYSFENVSKVVAISDIHGQYDIMLSLLKSHGVIDEDNQWIFDDGHLVIVGDNFDRGDKVLDILWFLFRLQKDAIEAGGYVHVLLGNHEAMVLNGDLRYLHRKYIFTTALFTTPYEAFFKDGSILGDWLATHPVMVDINNDLYLHAGLSPNVSRLALDIDTINQIFGNGLIRIDEQEIYNDTIHEVLYTQNGPLWYRGYFDSLEVAFDSIDYVFNRMDYNKIIIGHTSMDSITRLSDNRIINIDCSIKLGEKGQVLVIEDGKYHIGEMDGTKELIPEVVNESKKSLFEHIFEQDGLPKIIVETDVGRMKNRGWGRKEEYQPAHILIKDTLGQEIINLDGRVRARGNVRKEQCRFPPVKLDFSKSDLDSLGFLKIDKLKVVFPCKDRDFDQEALYKEELLYHIYNFIDSNCIRTKLVEFVLLEKGEEKNNFIGFLVEDESEYARRKDAIIIESGKLSSTALDREPFLKMDFFQYMISNTDWSLANKHNLELVKLPDRARVVALPYDFDYAGFVGQKYAVPHESLPIKTVHDRYFFSYPVTDEEFMRMVEYYASIEDDINNIIDGATHIKEKTRKKSKEYLGKFFKMLDNPDRMKKRMIRK